MGLAISLNYFLYNGLDAIALGRKVSGVIVAGSTVVYNAIDLVG